MDKVADVLNAYNTAFEKQAMVRGYVHTTGYVPPAFEEALKEAGLGEIVAKGMGQIGSSLTSAARNAGRAIGTTTKRVGSSLIDSGGLGAKVGPHLESAGSAMYKNPGMTGAAAAAVPMVGAFGAGRASKR